METKLRYQCSDYYLNGVLAKVADNDCVVVMCHGLNSTNEESGSFLRLSEKLAESQINSFRFDFFGHGESDGAGIDMTISTQLENIAATINQMRQLQFRHIVLIGASFGGGSVALYSAMAPREIEGVLLWYPVLSYTAVTEFCGQRFREAVQNGYVTLHSTRSARVFQLSLSVYMEMQMLSPAQNLAAFLGPIQIIHGDCDKITPISVSEAFSRDRRNVRLYRVKNGSHGFPVSQPDELEWAVKRSVEFCREILTR